MIRTPSGRSFLWFKHMAIVKNWKGSWGLPDVGATEWLSNVFGQGRTSQGGSNLRGDQSQTALVPSGSNNNGPTFAQSGQSGAYGVTQYTQPQNTVLPTNNSYSGGNTPSNAVLGTNTQNPYSNQQDNVNNFHNTSNSIIDQDYNQAMNDLGFAEQSLQSQAGTATAQIDSDALSARGEIASNQAIGEAGVQDVIDTGVAGAKTGMQQARDTFRQTQQSNNAQLSALGLSSSSVTEALAERLGVETARRIAGITDSLTTIQVNAKKELSRIKNYYTQKSEEVTRNVDIQKQQIRNSLMSGLNQINSSRYQAASAKAQARANLLYQTQTAITQLAQQEQEFNQALQKWQAQKTAALTPVVSDPNYLASIQNQQGVINQNFATTQFTYQPNFNSKGEVTGYSRVSTKKEEDPDNPEGLTPNGLW